MSEICPREIITAIPQKSYKCKPSIKIKNLTKWAFYKKVSNASSTGLSYKFQQILVLKLS